MKHFIINYFSHKELYIASISLGSITSFILSLFSGKEVKELFGISLTLWFIAFLINLIDIHTGIKADTVRKQRKGEKFTFESNKGWRALEKIVVFTIIISFAHNSAAELIRLKFPFLVSNIFLYLKVIFFFYVIILEIQSIGENEEVRFGKKSKGFLLLDKIIEVVNEGILTNIKRLLKIENENVKPNLEE